MKRTTKALLLVVCALVLVVGSVLGTVAYLTSKDSVLNTFTVGKVVIDLDEANVATPDTTDRTQTGNDYHLVPGMTYEKDPTVTVEKGSEEAYVRILVKVDNVNNLTGVFKADEYYHGDIFKLEKLVSGWNRQVWVMNDYWTENTTGVYEFRYYQPVDASKATENVKLEPLFTNIVLPGEEVTNANIGLLDAVQIRIEAQAIQTASFVAEGDLTAEDVAWNAVGR